MNLFWTRIPLFPIWPEFADLDGIRVPLRDSPLRPHMRRRLLRGFYETAERELLKLFVKPGDQVLELGASAGIVTSFLARAVGPTGRVVSLEADPKLRANFDRQLRANNLTAEWVEALACPLWAAEVPPELANKSFSSSADNLSGRAVETAGAGEKTRWLTAQAVCAQTKLQPTVVMMDIEGTEAIWIKHPPRFPASIRTVITEFHPHLTGPADAGRAIQAVVDEGFCIAGLRETVVAFTRG